MRVKHHEDIFTVLQGPAQAIHQAQPEIVIGPQEEYTDQNGLENKQPGKKTTHEGNSHLLVILIHLAHEPVACKG